MPCGMNCTPTSAVSFIICRAHCWRRVQWRTTSPPHRAPAHGQLKTQGAEFAGVHWQAGYGGFSISPAHRKALQTYIHGQREHNRTVTFEDDTGGCWLNTKSLLMNAMSGIERGTGCLALSGLVIIGAVRPTRWAGLSHFGPLGQQMAIVALNFSIARGFVHSAPRPTHHPVECQRRTV